MTLDPHADVDRTLREVFEPDAVTTDRIAAQALGVTGDPRPPARNALVVGLVSAVAALGAFLWLARQPAVPPEGMVAGLEAADLSGSLVDGTLVVSVPGDGVIILGPGERGPRPSDGYGIVFVEGEVQ